MTVFSMLVRNSLSFNNLLVREKSKVEYNYLFRVEANGKAALGQ